MNAMKFPPTEGGTFNADADGNLTRSEDTSKPNPGKSELAQRKTTKAAKADADGAAATSPSAKNGGKS